MNREGKTVSRRRLLALAWVLTLAGCGRRGPLRLPPEQQAEGGSG